MLEGRDLRDYLGPMCVPVGDKELADVSEESEILLAMESYDVAEREDLALKLQVSSSALLY